MYLYEIVKELTFMLLDEEFDEAKYHKLNLEKELKVEHTAKIIRNIEAEIESLSREIDELSIRKKAREKKIETITSYLRACIGNEKISTSIGEVKFLESKRCEIEDAEKIEKTYIKSVNVKKFDIAKAKRHLLDGYTVPGFKLTDAHHLRIK